MAWHPLHSYPTSLVSQPPPQPPRATPARRSFLKQSAIASGFLGLGLYLRADKDHSPSNRVINPYGPLVPDKAKLLDLPAGFTYQVISKRGTRMSDGLRVPGKFDDMAVFPGEGGRVILVRNHELALDQGSFGPFPDNRLPANLDRNLLYDPNHHPRLQSCHRPDREGVSVSCRERPQLFRRNDALGIVDHMRRILRARVK